MLKDRVALVTGASRGIGRQTALTLAENGARVIVNYNGNREKAEEVVALIQEKGGQAAACGFDVSDYEATGEKLAELIREYGRLDILVNNAGVTRDGLILKMSEADYDAVVDTNLKGTFNCIRHAARQMVKQRYGRIVNLSSVVGVYGNGGQVNYSASKAGIIGITKSVAKELGSRGITVNAVAPGFIVTEMTDAMPEDAKQQVAERIAMKRLGSTSDVADVIAFLASDKAAYVTGQVICVDGGMSI